MSSTQSRLMIGVSGIRGVVGETLTPEKALQFVQAFAAWHRECGRERPHLILARDTRPTGTMLYHVVVAGLLANGCRVTDLGVVPTPTLQLAIPHYGADGGICITASHNPVEWNALKFFQANGMYVEKSMGNRVIALNDQQASWCGTWQEMGTLEHDAEAVDRHLQKVLDLVDRELIASRKFKVVLDGCCGAGSIITPLLLEALGCEVIRLNCDMHGIFPHNPEPLNENLAQLGAAVSEYGADVGFAHDADADRVGVVTDSGEPIGEDYSLVWAVAHVLANRRTGTVVCNLSTSMAVEAVAAQHDCPVLRTAVGDINVSSRMRESGAVIGGEGNGGVIIPDIQYGRDGIAATGLLLEFLATCGQPASQVREQLPRFNILKDTVDFPNEKTGALLQWLQAQDKTGRHNTTDGLKIEWPAEGPTTSWVHIRPSGTEPLVRVICEAQTEAEARRILKSTNEQIAAVEQSL